MADLLTPSVVTSGPGPEPPEGALSTAGQGLSTKPLSPGRLAWRRFRRHKLAMASGVVLIVLTVFVFFPWILTDYGPLERTGDGRLAGPTAEHWFGTDDIQRDLFTRVLHGGQISLKVGFAVALVAGVVGSIIGAVAGFYGKWVDNLLMRATDLFLAIPLLVALIILTRIPGRHADVEVLLPSYIPSPVHFTVEDVMGAEGSVRAIVTILSLFFWMPMARIVRGTVLSLKEKEFVEAARALGASDVRILTRHLLPNSVGPIVVNVTLSVAAAILAESALSFLGYGVESATTPTWGNMLSNTKGFLRNNGHIVWFPGLAIVVTVLCVNYLGDGLRDALDPRQSRKS